MSNNSITLHVTESEFDGIVQSFLDDNICGIEELEERSTVEQIVRKYLTLKFEGFIEDACQDAEDSKSFEKAVNAALIAEENARWEDLNQRKPIFSQTDYPVFASLEVDDRTIRDRQDYYQDSWADRF